MNAAVLGGLVEQWVWRCQKVATRYQMRQPIDLQTEVEKLVGQAEVQARLLEAGGAAFLAKVESRLHITAHIAELPEPLAPDKLIDPLHRCSTTELTRQINGLEDKSRSQVSRAKSQEPSLKSQILEAKP